MKFNISTYNLKKLLFIIIFMFFLIKNYYFLNIFSRIFNLIIMYKLFQWGFIPNKNNLS